MPTIQQASRSEHYQKYTQKHNTQALHEQRSDPDGGFTDFNNLFIKCFRCNARQTLFKKKKISSNPLWLFTTNHCWTQSCACSLTHKDTMKQNAHFQYAWEHNGLLVIGHAGRLANTQIINFPIFTHKIHLFENKAKTRSRRTKELMVNQRLP